MTVAELPRLALNPERIAELCFLPLPPRLGQSLRHSPLAVGETRFAGGAIFASFSGLPKAQRPAPRVGDVQDAMLKSLAGSPLARRFHAWHGGAGRRYVCSVFRIDPAAPDAGLPEFTQAVVLAVARRADGGRQLVALCQCGPDADPYARTSFAIEALAVGAIEWHVHLSPSAAQRQAIIADIKAARTCGGR
jgi:hypothetical protein